MIVIAGILASAVFVSVIRLTLAASPPESPAASSTQISLFPTSSPSLDGTPVGGQIIYPSNGANEPEDESFNVYGTIQNAQPHHQLALFVERAGINEFYIVDPDVSAQDNIWLGSIKIAQPGSVTLWLVDLAPDAIRVLNRAIDNQTQGFPTLIFSSGVTLVDNVTFNVISRS
jgi:hypothetical protein